MPSRVEQAGVPELSPGVPTGAVSGLAVSAYPYKRALIVGATSGIGEAVARRLVAAGCDVAIVGRRSERLQAICAEVNDAAPARCLGFEYDVRYTSGAADMFQEITTALGGLDLMVYAAGIMPEPEAGESETTRDIRVIETNFAGSVAWLNAAAERFEIARSGTIVGISSVAGDRGRRPNAVYGATKAAMTSYLSSLRSRLARYGVTVLTVKPGLVRTQLLEGSRNAQLVPVISADRAAEEILAAAARGKRILYTPWWWQPVMTLVRAIPEPIFERLPF